MTITEAVLAALDTVRDPELDTSIVELGFVASHAADPDGTVRIRPRLPTYFCAPNFAFLMVADVYDAVAGVDGVTATEIVLEDHFASSEINDGVAARAGFVRSFAGQAERELDELRREFLRTAVLAGQDRVARPLLAAGRSFEDLGAMTLGDVEWSADLDRLRDRRRELGIGCGDGDPLLVRVDSVGVGAGAVRLHLQRARTVRVSIEANADYCRQLLAERYSLVRA